MDFEVLMETALISLGGIHIWGQCGGHFLGHVGCRVVCCRHVIWHACGGFTSYVRAVDNVLAGVGHVREGVNIHIDQKLIHTFEN